MTRVMTATTAAGAAALTLYPNGCRFNATDVFLGSGFIHEVSIAIDASGGTPAGPATLTIYDGITDSTGRIVNGGTTDTESYRVIAGAHSLTPQGDPFFEGALNAQVSGLRALVSRLVATDGRESHIRIPLDLKCQAGMVVSISALAVNATIQVNYTPWVTGGARRRRAYRPGSTTKVSGPGLTTVAL